MKHINYKWGSVGVGWKGIVDPLIAQAEAEGVEIIQIKEKFGGLRFYVGSASDEMHKSIDEAEHLAERTCEACGNAGSLRGGRWLKTLCDKCEEERK